MLSRIDMIARALRLGETAEGNDRLSELIDALGPYLTQKDRRALAPIILPILKEVLAAQQRGDWLYVADLLEHDLSAVIS